MNAEERRHWEELYKTYLKRLRVLELQQAEKGQNSPPELILEIQDYHKKAAEAERKLARLKPKSKKGASIANKKQAADNINKVEIEIVIKGDYDGLTTEKREAFLRAIAAIAEISFEQVEVLMVSRGSIVYHLNIPEEGAQKLLDLFNSKDPILEEMNIDRIAKASTSPERTGSAGAAGYERWLRGIRGEDPEAADTIVRYLYAWCDAALARYHHFDYEELRQRAIVNAWERIVLKHHQYSGVGSFLGWMRTLTNREVFKLLRIAIPERDTFESLDARMEHGDQYDPADTTATPPEPAPATGDITPLDAPPDATDPLPLLPGPRAAALRECCQTLTERQQKVIIGLLQGTANADLAEQLQVQRNNLNQIRHRTLLRLRRCMESKGYGYS